MGAAKSSRGAPGQAGQAEPDTEGFLGSCKGWRWDDGDRLWEEAGSRGPTEGTG